MSMARMSFRENLAPLLSSDVVCVQSTVRVLSQSIMRICAAAHSRYPQAKRTSTAFPYASKLQCCPPREMSPSASYSSGRGHSNSLPEAITTKVPRKSAGLKAIAERRRVVLPMHSNRPSPPIFAPPSKTTFYKGGLPTKVGCPGGLLWFPNRHHVFGPRGEADAGRSKGFGGREEGHHVFYSGKWKPQSFSRNSKWSYKFWLSTSYCELHRVLFHYNNLFSKACPHPQTDHLWLDQD